MSSSARRSTRPDGRARAGARPGRRGRGRPPRSARGRASASAPTMSAAMARLLCCAWSSFGRRCRSRLGRVAVAAQVGNDEREVGAEAARDAVPHRVRLRVAVQQQDRRPAALPPVRAKKSMSSARCSPRRESVEPGHRVLRVQPAPILVLARRRGRAIASGAASSSGRSLYFRKRRFVPACGRSINSAKDRTHDPVSRFGGAGFFFAPRP